MTTASTPHRDRLTFVRADAHHIPDVSALVEAYYAFDDIAFDAVAVHRGLAALIDGPSLGGVWLMRDESAANIGYFILTYGFSLEHGGRHATLDELYVSPAARRGGVGAQALRFIERHLQQVGIAVYGLEAERDNVAARAFYVAAGFAEEKRILLNKRILARDEALATMATPVRSMDTVDHVSLGVNDLAASKRFYDAALAPLGFTPRADHNEVGYFLSDDTNHHDIFALFIGFEDARAKRRVIPSAGFHIAFRTASRAVVIAFYEAALRAGGRDYGPPGLRPQYHANYFGAFVLDPDGHHIEAVCHRPEG